MPRATFRGEQRRRASGAIFGWDAEQQLELDSDEDPMANLTENAKAHAQAAAERAQARGRDHSGEDIIAEPFPQYQPRAGRLQEDFKAEVRERPVPPQSALRLGRFIGPKSVMKKRDCPPNTGADTEVCCTFGRPKYH